MKASSQFHIFMARLMDLEVHVVKQSSKLSCRYVHPLRWSASSPVKTDSAIWTFQAEYTAISNWLLSAHKQYVSEETMRDLTYRYLHSFRQSVLLGRIHSHVHLSINYKYKCQLSGGSWSCRKSLRNVWVYINFWKLRCCFYGTIRMMFIFHICEEHTKYVLIP